jgi:phosphoribosylamine-glycine ligase
VHAISDVRVCLAAERTRPKRIATATKGRTPAAWGLRACPLVTTELTERIRRDIFERTVNAMAEEGTLSGALRGLMITSDEPYLLEFNVRFGIPRRRC